MDRTQRFGCCYERLNRSPVANISQGVAQLEERLAWAQEAVWGQDPLS